MNITKSAVMLTVLVLCGCYFGWRCFMAMLEGDVSRYDLIMMITCYAGAVAVSAHSGGWFSM